MERYLGKAAEKAKWAPGFLQEDAERIWLAIFRTPQTGRPLDEKRPQIVEFVSNQQEAMKVAKVRPEDDLILVSLGSFFAQLRQRLGEGD